MHRVLDKNRLTRRRSRGLEDQTCSSGAREARPALQCAHLASITDNIGKSFSFLNNLSAATRVSPLGTLDESAFLPFDTTRGRINSELVREGAGLIKAFRRLEDTHLIPERE